MLLEVYWTLVVCLLATTDAKPVSGPRYKKPVKGEHHARAEAHAPRGLLDGLFGSTTTTTASGSSASATYLKQAQDAEAGRNAGWTAVGCYRDSPTRVLNGYMFDSDQMTTPLCMNTCFGKGYTYGGVQWGRECWCDSKINTGTWYGTPPNSYIKSGDTYGTLVPYAECQVMPCTGNTSTACGNNWRDTIFMLTDRTLANSAIAASSSASAASASAAAYSSNAAIYSSSAAVYSSSSLAAYSKTSASAAAASASAYSKSAAAYSTSSLSASAAAYSQSAAQYSANAAAYSQSSLSASAPAYSANSKAAAASSTASSLAAYSSAVAYSQSSQAAAASAAQYSSQAALYSSQAAQYSSQAAQYSQSSLAASASQYSASASAASASAARYSSSVSAAQYSASVAQYSSAAAQYSQSVQAASASQYSASVAQYSSAAAQYSQSVQAASAAQYSSSVQSASAAQYSASAAQYSAAAAQYSQSVQAASAAQYSSSVQAASAAQYSASAAQYSSAAAQFSASVQAASAAQYSASVAAASAAQYSASVAQSVSAAAYSASAAAASAAQYSASIQQAASVAAYSASAAAASASAAAWSASSSAAAAAQATQLPSTWSLAPVACVAEGTTGRALTGPSITSDNMNYGMCTKYCADQGYILAALQYSSECRCGNILSNGASLNTPSSNCNMRCGTPGPSTGANDICGGPNANTLFYLNSALSTLSSDFSAKPVSLVDGWTVASSPCIQEGSSGRALTGASYADDQMLPASCMAFCKGKGFSLAGVEFGRECYCGNSLANGASMDRTGVCQQACGGNNSLQSCGGSGTLSLFSNPTIASADAAAAAASSSSAAAAAASASSALAASVPSGWTLKGGIQEVGGRALTGAFTSASDMTIAKCVSYCSGQGFSISGIEYGSECYCGNSFVNGASLDKTSTQCTMPCPGASDGSICGGPDCLTIVMSTNSNVAASATSTVASAAASATSAAVSVTLPDGWTVKVGIKEVPGRALTGAFLAASNMTLPQCASFCSSKGFAIAGVEYSQECYCGNSFSNGASLDLTSDQCTMPCPGASDGSKCGGPDCLTIMMGPSVSSASSVVSSAVASASSAAASATASISLPAGWSMQGGIQEVAGRALTGASTTADDMTVPKCVSYCSGLGFSIAAVEYSRECYCGNSFSNGASLSLTSNQCNMPCPGANDGSICGGPDCLTVVMGPASSAASSASSAIASATSSAASTASSAAASFAVPSGWTLKGGIQEVAGRALTGASTTAADMTIAKCVSYCSGLGFSISAVEYGQECYCGNSFVNGASLSLTSDQCNMPCPGASDGSICGGPNCLTVLMGPVSSASSAASAAASTVSSAAASATATSSGPQIATNLPAGWSSANSANAIQEVPGRALTGYSFTSDQMTPTLCINTCASKGFKLAAIEYSSECYCDYELRNGASLDKTATATMPCSGDATLLCGGPDVLSIWTNPNVQAATSASSSAAASGTASASSTSSSAAGATPTPASNLPSGWAAASSPCIKEVANRALIGYVESSDDMTVNKCINTCASKGYYLAAVEYGVECHCSDALHNGASLDNTATCDMACSGDSTTLCGGSDALQLFQNNDLNAPIDGYTYKGCIQEVPGRALNATSLISGDMTRETCVNFCKSNGYSLSGTQYGDECYCSNALAGGASLDATGLSYQCNMPCAGDSTKICGGPDAIILYGSN